MTAVSSGQVMVGAFKPAMNGAEFLAEQALYGQKGIHRGPDDYGRALRAAYVRERRLVERLGLTGDVD